jgi:hypothetical protein
MNTAILQTQLQLPYRRETWQTLLPQIMPGVEMFTQPHDHPLTSEAEREIATARRQIGRAVLPDGSTGQKIVAFYEVDAAQSINLLRNRVALRQLVAKCIDEVNAHAVLAFFLQPGTNAFRLTYAAKQSVLAEDLTVETHETATRRFTYILGLGEPCRTAAQRLSALAAKCDSAELKDVTDAFSVEKLNNEFFDEYKAHYQKFVDHLLATKVPHTVFGVPRNITDAKQLDRECKPIRDFVKKMLGRIVFLHFLQKKGWLGCPADRKDWKNGSPDFLREFFVNHPDKDHFHSTGLVPLFYDALNRADRPNDIFLPTGTRIPYLNGGLFERESFAVEKIDCPSKLFEEFLDFLAAYNFTIDENDPEDHEVGIDPEMLGHIFENLLEDNKDKGAYYTPKPVVQYMCQQSLIYYLKTHLADRPEIERLVQHKDPGPASKGNWIHENAKEIERLLDAVKICDPAIGSGAFPIGLLQEIYWIKLSLDWTLDRARAKRQIIQHSIYGVDLDAGAVEIARLRFWLALIVEEKRPRPLPNLDYKIMQGDSLLESFEGIDLSNLTGKPTRTIQLLGVGQTEMGIGVSSTELTVEFEAGKQAEIGQLINDYFDETRPEAKRELHAKIDQLVLSHLDYNIRAQRDALETELKQHQADIKKKQRLAKGWQPPARQLKRIATLEVELQTCEQRGQSLRKLEDRPERPYFLWHLFFQDVFAKGGFDIVIANPPYVRADNPEILAERKAIEATEEYQTLWEKWDLYVAFIERGYKFLAERGVLTYIVSDAYCHSKYAQKSQNWFLQNAAILRLDFLGKLKIFEAGVRNVLFFFEKTTGADNIPERRVHETRFANVRLLPSDRQSNLTYRAFFPEDAVAKTFSKPTLTLDQICYISYGLRPSSDEHEAKGEFVTADLVSDTRDKVHSKPYVEGKHLGRWLPFTNLWLEWGTKRAPHQFCRPTFPEMYDVPAKIIAQRSPGPDPITSYDNKQFVFTPASVGFVPWHMLDGVKNNSLKKAARYSSEKPPRPDLPNRESLEETSRQFDVKYLLAVMNSAFARNFLRSIRRSNIHLYPDDWKKLPVPEASAEEQAAVVEVVDQILAAKRTNPNANIAALEALVDNMVSALYGIEEGKGAPVVAVKPGKAGLKDHLRDAILPALGSQSPYYNIDRVRAALKREKLTCEPETLNRYLHELTQTGFIYDAGRGWYSSIQTPFQLDTAQVEPLVAQLQQQFPLLSFACWSTAQIKGYMHHMLAKFVTFVYVPRDSMDAVAESLQENGCQAFLNPMQKEAAKSFKIGDKTVVVRPAISKEPVTGNFATVEKLLVDLHVESRALSLMDLGEFQRMSGNLVTSGRITVPVLTAYGAIRKVSLDELFGKEQSIIST